MNCGNPDLWSNPSLTANILYNTQVRNPCGLIGTPMCAIITFSPRHRLLANSILASTPDGTHLGVLLKREGMAHDGTVNDLRLSVHNVRFQGSPPDCDPILGVPKAETVQCHCLTFLTNIYATSQLERYLNFRYGTPSTAAEFLHRIG